MNSTEVTNPTELARYWRERAEKAEAALRVAADDLGKAANQFESLRLSPDFAVVNNGAIFAEKEARARAALERV